MIGFKAMVAHIVAVIMRAEQAVVAEHVVVDRDSLTRGGVASHPHLVGVLLVAHIGRQLPKLALFVPPLQAHLGTTDSAVKLEVAQIGQDSLGLDGVADSALNLETSASRATGMLSRLVMEELRGSCAKYGQSALFLA